MAPTLTPPLPILLSTPMTEHSNPGAFPEHLRPDLLPLPETRWEALFLLRCLSDLNREAGTRPVPKKQSTPDRSRHTDPTWNGSVAA